MSQVVDLQKHREQKTPREHEPSTLWQFMRDMARAGVWQRLARAERQVLPRTERFNPANGEVVQLEDGAALTLIQPAAPLYSMIVELPVASCEQKRTIVITEAIGALQIRCDGVPVLGWNGITETHGHVAISFLYANDVGWIRI